MDTDGVMQTRHFFLILLDWVIIFNLSNSWNSGFTEKKNMDIPHCKHVIKDLIFSTLFIPV